MSTPKWLQFSPPRKLASYDPHPHQKVFHQDAHKYRALVSGVGAGKTRMGVEEIIKWSQLYPGCLGVIGRLTAKSLRETTERRFFEVCPTSLIANYNKSEEHLWLKTNAVDADGGPIYSEILFYHLDDPGPLGSLDISWFWIDEAHEPDGGEVPENTFQMLTARLRHPVGPHRGFVTSNSGGKDWVWKRFFNPNGVSPDYTGWTVSTEANAKYLPPGYVEELRRDNSETWVKRFLDASFDAFEGQVFPDFDESVHVYYEDVEIPNTWDHGGGFDFGVTAPTAAVYGAVDQDGDIWMYGEDYQADAEVEEFAKKMRNRGFDSIYADPAVSIRGPSKKSPKQLYQEYHMTLIPSDNDTDYFLKLLIDLLKKRKPDGTPVIHISHRCTHLIEQIKQAAWDPMTLAGTSTHDSMKRAENHALDAFKYFLNMYGQHPGLLNPVDPHSVKTGSYSVHGHWEHESMFEDEDLGSDDYPFDEIKREVFHE